MLPVVEGRIPAFEGSREKLACVVRRIPAGDAAPPPSLARLSTGAERSAKGVGGEAVMEGLVMTMTPGSHGEIMVGNAIYTEDGDQIGTVKEIQGRFFKVDAPMKPDFWLSEDCIRSAGGARVTLTVDKDHLGDVKLSEPGPAMAPEGKNAIDLLKQMHVEAKGQLAQILATGNPQQAGDMWQKLQPVLKVHEQMEETYL